MSFKVRIAQADRTIEVPTGATILEAALDAGVGYPFGCQSGNCGACKSHLVKGEVTMEGYSEFALSDEEKARGLILACRAVPWAGLRGRLARGGRPDRPSAPPPRLQGRRPRRRHARHQARAAGDRIGRAVRFLGRPVRLGDLRGLPAARLFHGQRAGRSRARVPCPPHRGRRHQRACRREAQGRRQRARRGPVRRLLSAREPSRADHRRRRRLGHGADQVDRRAGAARRSCRSTSISISASAPSATSTCTTISRRWRRSTDTCISCRC